MFKQSPKKKTSIGIILIIIFMILIIKNTRQNFIEKGPKPEPLFAIYINDEKTTHFPSKEEGYSFDEKKSYCNNGVNIDWSYLLWNANINFTDYELQNKERTYCNLYFKTREEYTFDYTGSEQEFIIPKDGYYQIELWGASGGTVEKYQQYGKSGYTSGKILLSKDQKLYVYVGEQGSSNRTVAFNGGGYGGLGYDYNGQSGGGATDIRLANSAWNNFDSLKSRIMVSSGGGGCTHSSYVTAGENSYSGGLIGYSGGYYSGHTYVNQNGKGGSQISGGEKGNNHYNATGIAYTGIFGSGGNNETVSSGRGAGGGGGGYYGGGSGGGTQTGGTGQGGGGGSSFISGHNGCDAIKEESTSDNIIHTGEPYHYSGYIFIETKMIDGMGYAWTDTKLGLEAMPNPSGGYYDLGVGHTGNGYARITYLGK